MVKSSSPLPSSPISLTRSATLSARKTYSRRASVIREKRKAEALAQDTDDSDEDDNSPQGIFGGSTLRFQGNSAVKDGLPISKKAKGKQRATEEDTRKGIPKTPPSSRLKNRRLTSSRSLPSSPPAESRTPSPSPPPIKKTKSSPVVPLSSQKTTSNPLVEQSAPKVDIHPPSSSPPMPPDAPAPSTPPRKLRSLSKTNTPQASPSSYEELFAAVSPRKDYFDTATTAGDGLRPKLGRPGGMRRMLTKTQSMSAVPTTPSKDKEKKEEEGDENDEDTIKSSFGRSMDISPARTGTPPRPTTPSKTLLRTQSMPDSPSRSSPKGQPHHQDTTNLTVNNAQAGGSGGSGGRAKRTYGGKRSMLAEVSQVSLDIANVSREDIGATASETAPEATYAQLRTKYEIDNEESENGSGNLMAELLLAKAPQTVSDMRSKGENRRFMDELSYLIDGITDSSMSISFKITSAIDILRNMQDESWLSKMKVCGQVEKVWQSFIEAVGEDEPDPSMETIAMLFLATLQQSDSGIEQILQNNVEKALQLVLGGLKIRDGPLDTKLKGKGNNGAQKIRNIFSTLQLSSTYPIPSTRLLASVVLQGLCQADSSEHTVTSMNSADVLSKVLIGLKTEIKGLGDRYDLYEKGLDMLPSDAAPNFDYIYVLLQVVFRLMDSSDDIQTELIEGHKDLTGGFMNILITTSTLVLNPEEELPSNLSQCVLQTLQLLIVIANSSSEWAAGLISVHGASTTLGRLILQRQYFLPKHLTAADEDDDDEESQRTEVDIEMKTQDQPDAKLLEQDFLCTVLALIIQAIRSGKEARNVMAHTQINISCKGKYGCLRRCHCLDVLPLTHHLSDIYADYYKEDENLQSKAIAGYLALVITQLLSAATPLRDGDIKTLPGKSIREKLEGLRGSLRGLKYEVHQNLKQILKGSSSSQGDSSNLNGEEEEEDGEDEGEMETLQEALDALEEMIKNLI